MVDVQQLDHVHSRSGMNRGYDIEHLHVAASCDLGVLELADRAMTRGEQAERGCKVHVVEVCSFEGIDGPARPPDGGEGATQSDPSCCDA